MRYHLDGAWKFSGRAVMRNAAICGILLTIGGCASNIEEGVGPVSTVPSISGSAPQNTGTYPNLNIRPQAAGPQLTPQEQTSGRTGLVSSASAAKAGVGASSITEEERLRLLTLAKDRGDSVLADIEGKQ
ncbi:hypothetical protein [Arvimicrobium flavum]|uniref:hypothetical protein n=1 Tax=Arvimicrobium flavum TaxID=3393320 RepID=UPI00237B23DE|nr:hypothetical protein [Mesorhizobium shangrilense]